MNISLKDPLTLIKTEGVFCFSFIGESSLPCSHPFIKRLSVPCFPIASCIACSCTVDIHLVVRSRNCTQAHIKRKESGTNAKWVDLLKLGPGYN
ncbi:hypothetical protein GDO86_017618 [Hymenochirus boettgeri]|uniref:Uncharacterized protein n=1 Tax=Hymenochirus boettgeri TaxID=247094 RepID=A0A8T2ITA7_9PIPI|nr:hypothetical protein GDO86_017618 [Hymenochirus boettgeri]